MPCCTWRCPTTSRTRSCGRGSGPAGAAACPVAGTEEQALRALARSSPGPAALLAVTSLRDGSGRHYTVTPGRRGGFRIRSPGLPRTCLSAADTLSVAYVAVPRELRDVILQEGYQPSRRHSVPTSPSRAGAAEAFCRNHDGPFEVLGVLLDQTYLATGIEVGGSCGRQCCRAST
ncbi:unnamed protein product [Prorocentrum cordatum]|uniref:Uncharacterized protein n=1 Tax=Prorocentrum cordatum TaxID=2364126 RepID=A0ABN9VJA1_9DINO|nr:unnamed protein product [Polarella glacialis]